MKAVYSARIVEDPEYLDSKNFLQSVCAKEGVADYDWAFDYAKELWAARREVRDMIDQKADSVIRYLGGGIGLFALGLIAKADSTNGLLVILSIVPMLAAFVSIGCAVMVRKPTATPMMISVRDLEKTYLTENFPTAREAKAAFLGQWDAACTLMSLTINQKAVWLMRSTWAYFASLVLLLLPVSAAIVTSR